MKVINGMAMALALFAGSALQRFVPLYGDEWWGTMMFCCSAFFGIGLLVGLAMESRKVGESKKGAGQ